MDSTGTRNVNGRDAVAAKRPLKRTAADFLNEDDAPIGRAANNQLSPASVPTNRVTRSSARLQDAGEFRFADIPSLTADIPRSMEAEPTGLRPLPVGKPPAASNLRAAFCQALPYWRVHQGGVHSNNKIATGMLMNGPTTPRDVIQNQVIITTV